MATGGNLLTGSDRVTDQLITLVSTQVISETRKTFATGTLGLGITKYGQIKEDEQYSCGRNLDVSTIDILCQYFSVKNQFLI